MSDVSREQLHAYLDDSLDDADTARIEKLIRTSAEMRTRLTEVREERDRGEHSLGGVWRREGLSCMPRESLSGFLHGVLEADLHRYVDFHIKTIGCTSCLANLEDLKEKQTEAASETHRRRRYFETSARMLKDAHK